MEDKYTTALRLVKFLDDLYRTNEYLVKISIIEDKKCNNFEIKVLPLDNMDVFVDLLTVRECGVLRYKSSRSIEDIAKMIVHKFDHEVFMNNLKKDDK